MARPQGQIESIGAEDDGHLAERSSRGALWAVGGQAVAEPLRIAATAVLARLLSPSDFGIVGMAAVFFGLTAITTELGPAAAIIRQRELDDDTASSLFWMTTLAGLGIALAAAACAPLVAAAYGQPEVGPVFAALAATVALSGAALVHNAILRRRMDFRSPAIANLASVVVNTAVALVLAARGAGYWSLVAGTLAGVVTSILVVFGTARFRPRLRLRYDEVRSYLSFSGAVTAGEVANYGSTNVDNLVIGRVLGSSALGFYALAYNLVTYPVRMFSSLVAQATLPALCRIAEDAPRFRAAYLRATRLSLIVVAPALAAAFVAAPRLLLGLYGPQWAPAVRPFQLLCVAGLARSLSVFARSAFKAAGRPGLQMRWDLTLLVAVLAAAAFGSRFGLDGAAAAVAGATGIVSLATLRQVNGLAGLRTRDNVRAVVPSFGLALAVGATGGVLARLASPLPSLAVAALSLLVPLGLAWAVGRRVFSDVADLESLVAGAVRRKRGLQRADGPERGVAPVDEGAEPLLD